MLYSVFRKNMIAQNIVTHRLYPEVLIAYAWCRYRCINSFIDLECDNIWHYSDPVLKFAQLRSFKSTEDFPPETYESASVAERVETPKLVAPVPKPRYMDAKIVLKMT